MTSIVRPVVEGFNDAMGLAKSLVFVPIAAAALIAKMMSEFAHHRPYSPRIVIRTYKVMKTPHARNEAKGRADDGHNL